MPKKSTLFTPKYCLHKATGQGFVKLNGAGEVVIFFEAATNRVAHPKRRLVADAQLAFNLLRRDSGSGFGKLKNNPKPVGKCHLRPKEDRPFRRGNERSAVLARVRFLLRA